MVYQVIIYAYDVNSYILCSQDDKMIKFENLDILDTIDIQ